jgi:hypothetical protein
MKFHIAIFIAIILASTLMLLNIDVVTLFKGSHATTSISSSQVDISCTSCHSKIALELQNSTIHSNFKCEECHRLQQTAEGKTIVLATHNETGVYVGEEAHAAYTPRCLDCHGSNGIYINDTGITKQAPPANPFNETDYGSDYSAHKPFVKQALDYDLSIGENEACLACHTGYNITLTFKYPEYINWTLKATAPESVSDRYYVNYTPISYELGPYRTYSVLLEREGEKHTWTNTTNISCITCHERVYLGSYGRYDTNVDDWVRQHAGDVVDKGKDPATHQTEHPPTDSYCLDCHRNLNYASYPNLHANEVHAAEALKCIACHSDGGPWPPSSETFDKGGHNSTDFYQDISSFPTTIIGDMCISCHIANDHQFDIWFPDGSNACKVCHDLRGDHSYYIDINIYKEPKANETLEWLDRVFSRV